MKINYNPFENFGHFGKVKGNLEDYQYAQEENEGTLEESTDKPNFLFYYLIIFACAIVLILKLVNLQIKEGAKHEYLAEDNRIRSRDLNASRGNIYDQTGELLTKNKVTFNLELTPADLPQEKSEREKIYNTIQAVSGIDPTTIKKKVDKSGLYSLDPIILKEKLTRDEALLMEVRYKNISGVTVAKEPSRDYLTVPGLSHILGYIGKVNDKDLEKNSNLEINDEIGKSGIEQVYDGILRGKDGQEQVEVDSRGQIQRILATKDPTPGNNLYLTINNKLQNKMAEVLGNKISEVKAEKGVAIAMNPKDGSILGMVSLPTYDNNIFSSANLGDEYKKLLEDAKTPMLNRAISGIYPSGSVIKPIIASAGLQEGVITEDTSLYAPKEIKIGDWVFPDWKEHGIVDVRKALAVSSNVFFYATGGGYENISGLGLDRLKKYFESFGFGNKTNIDLTSEASGLIPDEEWKKKNKNESWYTGDTYHLSIGQGDFLTTPMQILNAISVVANGGELVQPHLAQKETSSDGTLVKEYGKTVIRDNFVSKENLQIVREGMRQCVTDGSCKQLQDLPVEAAGKTGTAQVAGTDKTHAWFTAFAPYEDPEIAIIALVELGGEGNVVAEPIGKDILQYYFSDIKK